MLDWRTYCGMFTPTPIPTYNLSAISLKRIFKRNTIFLPFLFCANETPKIVSNNHGLSYIFKGGRRWRGGCSINSGFLGLYIPPSYCMSGNRHILGGRLWRNLSPPSRIITFCLEKMCVYVLESFYRQIVKSYWSRVQLQIWEMALLISLSTPRWYFRLNNRQG